MLQTTTKKRYKPPLAEAPRRCPTKKAHATPDFSVTQKQQQAEGMSTLEKAAMLLLGIFLVWLIAPMEIMP